MLQTVVSMKKHLYNVIVHKLHSCNFLRYYATFKVRKSQSFFNKIDIFLQKTTTCTGLQAE